MPHSVSPRRVIYYTALIRRCQAERDHDGAEEVVRRAHREGGNKLLTAIRDEIQE